MLYPAELRERLEGWLLFLLCGFWAVVQWGSLAHNGFMPLFAFIVGILLVWGVVMLSRQVRQGRRWPRWILGGGAFLSLLVASRVLGARVLYAFLPLVQRWMSDGGAGAGSQRRDQRHSSEAPVNQGMSRQEAALILGIEADASPQEVKRAYKQLMLKLHPDQGGNDYLAGKLNQARETLLKSSSIRR